MTFYKLQNVRFFNSIYAKILLVIVFALIITPILVYVDIQNRIRPQLLEDYNLAQQQQLVGQVTEFDQLYDNILDNLLFFRDIPMTQDCISTQTDNDCADVADVFLTFLLQHQEIDQIRLINTYGMEIVRVNQLQGDPQIVPSADLQDKSTRDYFIATSQLNADDIYISDFDLNRENGQLEIPYKPTVRLAVPLYYDNDTLQGILVMNLLTDQMFSIISTYDVDSTYYIVNGAGDIMFTNADNASEIMYGTDLAHDTTFSDLLPLTPQQLQQSSDTIYHNGDISYRYGAITVTDVVNPQSWYIIIEEDAGIGITLVNQIFVSTLILMFVGSVVALSVGALQIRALINPLKKLEQASMTLEDQEWDDSITIISSISANDEIGTLAKAFENTMMTLQRIYNNQEDLVRERTRQLEEAHDRLRHIDETKTQLVEHIVHDVATPVSVIMTSAYRLKRRPETYLEVSERITNHAKRIRDLLNNIRDLRYLDAVDDPLDEVINFDKIVLSVVNRITPTLTNDAVTIALEVQEVPEFEGNTLLIEQLVENVFTNAVKYTPSGEVIVRLEQEANEIVLKVSDTGIGIPKEDLPRIGQRFFRASNTPDQVHGTGVGMGIVHKAIAVHAGTLDIASELGVGTTLTIRIPLV